jgi:hypothetical protein
VVNQFEVSLGPRDTHYVVVQLQDDPAIVESSVNMTGKHFNNTFNNVSGITYNMVTSFIGV